MKDKKKHNIANSEADKILKALRLSTPASRRRKQKTNINSVNSLASVRKSKFYKDFKQAGFIDYEDFPCLVKVKCWIIGQIKDIPYNRQSCLFTWVNQDYYKNLCASFQVMIYDLTKLTDRLVIWIPFHKSLKNSGSTDYVEGNVMGKNAIVICYIDNHVFIADT